MNTVDVNKIKKMIQQEYSGKPIYLTISGSHLYGFDSKDSDIDYRGCFLFDTNNIFGLNQPRDYIERNIGMNDIVLFELGKEAHLLNKGNCNVFEHLFAKPLITSDEYFELKSIVKMNLNISGLYQSYRGMAWENYNKFCLKGQHTIKKFLYVFRGLLAGMYVIEHGMIQPNLETLLQNNESTYYYEPIMRLIKMKRDGLEKDFLTDKMLPEYNRLADNLFGTMDAIYEKYRPKEKDQMKIDSLREAHLDQFLRKTRRNHLKQTMGYN